mmetsp:Transcript_67116/g.196990  ORF Transcript_67116/g.196990 Transcript_67116/m.196990 type:complete len:237 (+) Transcript_67116:981-1691(+)
MEACARRRLPQASALQAPRRGGRLRHPAAGLRGRHPHLLRRWLPLPRAPRIHPAGGALALHVCWHPGGLHVGAVLQDVEGRGLEEDHADDGFPIPGDGVRDIFHPQPVHLGGQVIRGGALHHDVCPPRPVVRHLGPPGLPRGVLRLQEGAHHAAGAHEPDPAPDPRAAVVHQRPLLLDGGRHPSLRCGLHGAVLYHVLHLAASVLLPLWLPHARHCDPGGHLRRDLDHADVFPAHQ